MVITKIERQNKNPSRVSLYLDNDYAIGIHKEVLLRFGFRVGDHISEATLQEVRKTEELRQVRESALRLLSYRARSRKEMEDRLKKKGYSTELIEDIIRSLGSNGLLNDLEFARAFAHDKLMRKPMGRTMLRQHLRQKGISKEQIEQVLGEVYPDDAEEAYALELASKRVKRSGLSFKKLDPLKQKKRLSDYLARRGFDWETVAKAVETALPKT